MSDTPSMIDQASAILAQVGERMMPALEAERQLRHDMLLHGISIMYGGERIAPEDLFIQPPTED